MGRDMGSSPTGRGPKETRTRPLTSLPGMAWTYGVFAARGAIVLASGLGYARDGCMNKRIDKLAN